MATGGTSEAGTICERCQEGKQRIQACTLPPSRHRPQCTAIPPLSAWLSPSEAGFIILKAWHGEVPLAVRQADRGRRHMLPRRRAPCHPLFAPVLTPSSAKTFLHDLGHFPFPIAHRDNPFTGQVPFSAFRVPHPHFRCLLPNPPPSTSVPPPPPGRGSVDRGEQKPLDRGLPKPPDWVWEILKIALDPLGGWGGA